MDRSQLHPYQIASVEHIINTPRCGLFLDMGLGKTVSSLTAIVDLMEDYLEVTKTLVIAPKRVAESVWDAEIKKWSHTKHLKISKVIGNEKKRRIALKANADIFTISRDNVSWLCSHFGGSMLPFDMVIIDESSSFKNHQAVKFKSLKKVIPAVPRVVLLTGTPAPNGYLDLWAQIYLLDLGARFTKFITRYREAYFFPKHSGWGYDLKFGCEKDIQDKIKDICISMKAEDYLDLPGTIDAPVELNMSDILFKKYREFEKEKVLQLFEGLGEEEITAVNAAALSNKLLQFSNGAVYDEERNVHHVHNIKIEAAKEIVESANGKPVLIAWTYRHDLTRLLKALAKHNPVHLQTDDHIKQWNKGQIRVLLMHPASGGHGLNLQYGGNILIWFGQTWSLELYQQLNKRLDRQGQTEKVSIHKLIMKNTIDEQVVGSLENKAGSQEGLMQAVKAIVRRAR